MGRLRILMKSRRLRTVRRCVLVFSRSPERESVSKGMLEARSLFELGRRRLARVVAGLDGVALVHVGTDPSDGDAWRLPQRGRLFGERFANAFSDVFALGYDQVLAVGGDVPSLSASELAAAFEALGDGKVALGPSPDGGVYLIGVSGDPRGLLGEVRWRTAHVLEDLLFAIEERGKDVALLRELADVDRRSDLRLLSVATGLDPELLRLVRTLLRRSSRRAEAVAGRTLSAYAPLSGARPPPLAA
jgi:hypothetical protein